MDYFAITSDLLDITALAEKITIPGTGAVCVFVGTVRGLTKGKDGTFQTEYLHYEAYEPMAEKKLQQVASEIRERYPKTEGIAIVQRIGDLRVGDITVAVACSSGHRTDGVFEAARYGIDRLKEIVPIWKKEVGPGGSVWVEGSYHPTPQDVSSPTPARAADESPGFALGCPACQEQYPLDTPLFRCACGEPFEILGAPGFSQAAINRADCSMWRYRSFLLPPTVSPITLGEGWTPLIPVKVDGSTVHLKLEYLNPSGSFKDRSASLLVSILTSAGITIFHDDSSGNAGAALAAYAARAGSSARLFVPEDASPVKKEQIALYGAQLIEVPGPRYASTQAAEAYHAQEQSYYASHACNPFTPFAYKSIAYELWEQLGCHAPGMVILPLGHGTQLLGLAQGFHDLLNAGLIEQQPRLVGVQAQSCAPLWRQYHKVYGHGGHASTGSTIAEGINISEPVRANAILEAVRISGGTIVVVDEKTIIGGLQELAARGILVEPTSAVVWPALQQVIHTADNPGPVVLSLTGSGFKTPNKAELIH
jgi:threonine synthase